jgi:hypothetical protein
MKKWICAMAAGAMLSALASGASATVLAFDDIGNDGFMTDVASGHYGGLDWSAGDWFAYSEPQDPYNAHSGEFRLASGFGDDDGATAIRFDTSAVFQGAWFSGLDGALVTFDLYYQGTQVGTSATLDPGAAPQFLASGYAGLVDEVVVASPAQGSYTMDDFTFTQVVPEPAPLGLMLAGLAVVGLRARRRPHA